MGDSACAKPMQRVIGKHRAAVDNIDPRPVQADLLDAARQSWDDALALGAAAVQIGTAYLFCPEAKITAPHRAALKAAFDDDTVLTRVFTGRPARGIVNRVVREVGAMSEAPPEFPLAGGALMPLRGKSEPAGSGDFTPMWSGQAMRLGREMSTEELTRTLVREAQERLRQLAGG